MPSFVVVLVEPKFEGNVGAVARAMANFGLDRLVLLNPPELGDEARERALHAWPIVENARVAKTLEEALGGIDFAVGTASDVARNEKRALREPTPLREFAKSAWNAKGTIGLLLGREDFGLVNDEIERCNLVVKIPTSPHYPSMNLSHAAAVVFYELFASQYAPGGPRLAERREVERLLSFFDQWLQAIDLPPHRVRVMNVTFRRLLGRAMVSKWEYHRLMGLFSGSVKHLARKRQAPAPRGKSASKSKERKR